MIKVAAFDNDGVLLDSLDLGYASVRAIFNAYEVLPPPLMAYRQEIKSDFMHFYWSYGIPKTAKPNDLNTIRRQYFLDHWHDAHFYPGVKELLARCRKLGLKTALVSAEIETIVEQRLAEEHLHSYFDFIRSSARDKTPVLLEICAQFNVEPSEVIYVGDTTDDIEAAKRAGVISVGITSGYNSPERIKTAQPTLVVHSLEDIKQFLTNVKPKEV